MVHCREELSSVIVLPGFSGSPTVPEWVQEFVTEENTADSSTLVHSFMINSIFVTTGNVASVVVPEVRPLMSSCPMVFVPCVSDCLRCFSVVPFRFILVFSCLVLSVFSTIPAHQDFSSYCLLILVRNQTTFSQI